MAKGPLQSANKESSAIWPEVWSAFAPHREKITKLLISVANPSRGKLCVWGAGRTTDLDLITLLEHYKQIDLVDIRTSLTQQALVERGFDEHPCVNLLPAMDLSGLDSHWKRISELPDRDKLGEIAKLCSEFAPELGQYDVVVSTCLLSQILIHTVKHLELASGIRSKDPSLFGALKVIREKHIELLIEHTLPGGTALLVTDLTSREKLPKLLESNVDLEQLISTEVIGGNHFHGLNPKLIVDLAQSPGMSGRLRDVNVSGPWVWDSVEMQYLCLAFRFGKR